MYYTLKYKKRSPFLLVEVLIALILIGSLTPTLFQSQVKYKKQLQTQSFYDDLESALNKYLFNLYYRLHEKDFLHQISLMSASGQELVSPPSLEAPFNHLPIRVLIKRFDKPEHKNFDVQVQVTVESLPFKLPAYVTNTQNYFLKKDP